MGALQNILYGIWRGIYDSVRGFLLIFTLDDKASEVAHPVKHSEQAKHHSRHRPAKRTQEKEPSLRQRLLECCALNGGVLLLSLLLFEYAVLPALRLGVRLAFGAGALSSDRWSVWMILNLILTYTFSALWVLPIFGISKIINCIWFQDIADTAYRSSQGRASSQLSVSILVADTLFSIFAQALFLIQGMLASLVLPIYGLGDAVCLLHMCLLYALYSFEYKWFNMGWELHKRLAFIETEWPYFLGFGLPLALLTQIFPSYIMNGCLFSLVFPVFILSGNEAEPVVGLCATRLQLFTPVIMVSNALFRRTVSVPASGSRPGERRPVR
ncbi:etoposide-induced protein 2.4-like isoform X2 [Amphibalanus amphitrite]|uniref:etoposide-induced protein 2.4-like isoform X2 n=1 Tax=Amphibalanus amphitrite TaxID=1232801 RepID=UPI001C927819|nr:etoposide-induced protein 2.4-like isoform X2 [Amphibalanus amphitrite]XP_043242391.1 etoposide-induced protein 2.4-like isoform X2 [Amphibalanus amphitrite]XP_043242392.1 etoposide-induced protein 2.4-like isoform X2 [Amphibalanus amphitrite]XP_043242393.1 etoposide-induced protein 2.4-like isoform X2 [Amphibalanus amphitrite]